MSYRPVGALVFGHVAYDRGGYEMDDWCETTSTGRRQNFGSRPHGVTRTLFFTLFDARFFVETKTSRRFSSREYNLLPLSFLPPSLPPTFGYVSLPPLTLDSKHQRQTRRNENVYASRLLSTRRQRT